MFDSGKRVLVGLQHWAVRWNLRD